MPLLQPRVDYQNVSEMAPAADGTERSNIYRYELQAANIRLVVGNKASARNCWGKIGNTSHLHLLRAAACALP